MTVDITIPTAFTPEHAAALGQYLRSEARLDRTQWQRVWEAADILRRATATLEGKTQTLRPPTFSP